LKFNISIAKELELTNIRKFIKKNWNEKHILAKNVDLIKEFYGNKKKLNFFIAKNNNKIIGILGFVPSFKFSKHKNCKDCTIWIALLKTLDKYPGLGIKLVLKLIKTFNNKYIAVNGINENVEKLYALLGFKIGILRHFYKTNEKINKFYLVKKNQKNKFNNNEKKLKNNKLIEINSSNIDVLKDLKYDDKNKEYILNKYIKNRFYEYSVIANYSKKKILSVLVFRICNHKNNKSIRIVDFLGNFNKSEILINYLNKLMLKINAEYIDFYQTGISQNNIIKNQFIENLYNNQIVIPNYYEPFLKKNIKIKYAILKNKNVNKFKIFKADGDQERPNILINTQYQF
jgi:hypothetical protein